MIFAKTLSWFKFIVTQVHLAVNKFEVSIIQLCAMISP